MLSRIVGLYVIGFSVGFWAVVRAFRVALSHHDDTVVKMNLRRLTNADGHRIEAAVKQGMSLAEIARNFGVSRGTVARFYREWKKRRAVE